MNVSMPRFKPKGVLERTAAGDLWKHTLSRIPTLYGRITYLAALRDPNSGIYRHHGLLTVFGREESGKALEQSHEQAFLEWLELPMADKSEDLKNYVHGLDDPPETVVQHLLTSRIFETHPPTSARRVQRQDFCNDVEVLLDIFRNEGSSPPPSPHR
jgi:hypothetical protein